MSDQPETQQRCRTANCPERQVAALCPAHGGPGRAVKAEPKAKAPKTSEPADTGEGPA